MSEEVRVSRELVISFWVKRVNEDPKNHEAFAKLYDVQHADPKNLVPELKAIRHILGRAIKELEGKR